MKQRRLKTEVKTEPTDGREGTGKPDQSVSRRQTPPMLRHLRVPKRLPGTGNQYGCLIEEDLFMCLGRPYDHKSSIGIEINGGTLI